MAYPDNHKLLSEMFGSNTQYTTGSNTYQTTVTETQQTGGEPAPGSIVSLEQHNKKTQQFPAAAYSNVASVNLQDKSDPMRNYYDDTHGPVSFDIVSEENGHLTAAGALKVTNIVFPARYFQVGDKVEVPFSSLGWPNSVFTVEFIVTAVNEPPVAWAVGDHINTIYHSDSDPDEVPADGSKPIVYQDVEVASGVRMGGDGFLHIDIKQLPEVNDHTSITPTGIVLAMIKAIQQNQGIGDDRKVVVQDSSRLIATREGISSLRERFSIDFWSSWVNGHDPDNI